MPQSAAERYKALQKAHDLKYGVKQPQKPLAPAPVMPSQEAAKGPRIDQAESTPPDTLEGLPGAVKRDLGVPEHLERVGRGLEGIPEAFGNAPKSAFKLLKGIGYDLPKAIGETAIGGVKYARDAKGDKDDPRYQTFKYLWENPKEAFQKMVSGSIKYNKEYYTNFWDSFVEDPFAFVSDVTSALSLGGGAVAGLGRATGSSMLRNAGSGIRKAGRYAEWVDPISLTGKVAKKGLKVSGIASHLGFGSPNTDMLLENLHLNEALRDTTFSKRLATLKGFTANMADDFNRATHLGDAKSIARVKSNPVTKELFEAQSLDEDWLKLARELDGKTAYKAKIVHAVEYLKHRAAQRGSEWTAKKAAKAKDWATSHIFDETYNPEGTFNPGFASLYEQPRGGWVKRLIGSMADDPRADKTYGRLLSVTGGGDYIWDPKIYLPKMWRGFYHNKFKRDFLDSSLIKLMRHDPEGVKVGRFNRRQVDALEGAGFKEMPVDLYKAYFDHALRVQAVHLRQLASGVDPGTALKQTETIIKRLMNKRGFWKSPSGKQIFIREADSNLMRFALAVPGSFARIYDKVLGSWKVGQTLFNPGFYLQQLFGNGVLAWIAGISPWKAYRLARKVRGGVPAQMGATFQEGIEAGPISGVVAKLGQGAAEIDNTWKTAIMRAANDKSAAEMAERLGVAGKGMEETLARQMSTAPQLQMEMDLYTQRLMERALDPYVTLNDLYKKMSSEVAALKAGTHTAALGQKLHMPQAMKQVHSQRGVADALAVNAVGKKPLSHMYAAARVQELFKKYKQVFRNAPKAYRAAIKQAVDEYHAKQTPYASVPAQNMLDLNNRLDNLLATYSSVIDTTVQRLASAGQVAPALNQKVLGWKRAFAEAASLNPQRKVWLIQNILRRVQDDIAKTQDDIMVRISEAIEHGRVPRHLQQLATEGTKNINLAHDLLGSINRLHPLTRAYVKRALPYYTFAAAVTKLAFNAPYMWPKRIALSHAVVRMWKDILEDIKGNQIGSDILEDYEPIMVMKDGSVLATKLTQWSVTSPLNTIEAGRSGFNVPSVVNPLTQHPMLRLLIDVTGRPVMRKGQIVPGEDAVALSDGSQWKFDGKRLQRVTPRVGVMRALINQFPLLKAVDRALTGHVQTEQGWSGDPDPYLKFGKPQYEITPSEKAMGFFIPTTRVSHEERDRLDKLKTIAILRRMAAAIPHASPEKRKKLREAIGRYGAGITDRTLDY